MIIIDDTELEIIVNFEDGDVGQLQLIKTRQMFIVEAQVPFTVCNEIMCEESYNFPEDKLLINSESKYFKNL